MLRITRDELMLARLPEPTMQEAGILERQHLQQLIKNSPDAFFAEIGETLMLVGESVSPLDNVRDQIDLLAIDIEGRAVIIELKRSEDRRQMLQAISYAGMIARWSPDRIVEQLARYRAISIDEAREAVAEFVEEPDQLNGGQRIILVAGSFDAALLLGAEWLSEKHDVDVRCYRLTLSKDGNSEYLQGVCAYPPQETLQFAAARAGRAVGAANEDGNWEQKLAAAQNQHVVDFFREELARNREANPRYASLHFRLEGRRRFSTYLKQRFASIRQHGRFENDLAFWRERMSQPDKIYASNGDRNLKLRAFTAADLKAFREALQGPLADQDFMDEETEE